MASATSTEQPPNEEAGPSGDASAAEVPASASHQTAMPMPRTSDLRTTEPPSVQHAPASHGAGDGGDVTVGFRGRRRNYNTEQMRAEMLALVCSPLCWRPLMVFVFSLVVGAALAVAAYCFKSPTTGGKAVFPGNDTS